MKLTNTLAALILTLIGSFASAQATSAAAISNCKIVEDGFPVPMIDEMSGISTNADGTLALSLAIQIPREAGGSTVEEISQTFKNPTGVNKNIYKSNGLTLELWDRPTDGTSKTINVVARVKGKSAGLKINVLMICEETRR